MFFIADATIEIVVPAQVAPEWFEPEETRLAKARQAGGARDVEDVVDEFRD